MTDDQETAAAAERRLTVSVLIYERELARKTAADLWKLLPLRQRQAFRAGRTLPDWLTGGSPVTARNDTGGR